MYLSSQRPAVPLGVLPGTDAELALAALDIVELGAWLLAACDAPLLCLALTPDERAGEQSITPWDRSMRPDTELRRCLRLPRSPHRALMAKLDDAAVVLFDLLRNRWPPYAHPPRLGVITDGSGIGFSPDDPWPLRAGWLSHQVVTETRLTSILPFHEEGSWSMLTAQRVDHHSH